MFRKAALTVVLFVGCMACLLLSTRAESGEPPSAGAFKSVASVEGLMAGQGLVYKELQRVTNGPKAADRAKNIQFISEALAELANVNIQHGEKDDYRNWATQLRDTALELAAEAKKKASADDAKMKSLIGRLESTCTACHDAYQ